MPEFCCPADHAFCATLGAAADPSPLVYCGNEACCMGVFLSALAYNVHVEGWICLGVWLMLVFGAAGWSHRTPKRCPRCQEVNRNYARFCANCGMRLGKE